MSFNPNFYNPLQGNYYTSHDSMNASGSQSIPELPPQFPLTPATLTDEEIVKDLTFKLHTGEKMHLPKKISINSIGKQLYNICIALNKIKQQEKVLSEHIEKLTDDEWKTALLQIKTQKDSINNTFSVFNDSNLKLIKNLLAKRSAKRLRLKRVLTEKRKDKENKIKKLQEQSRKINENLQRIKDDINKAKQEEDTKLLTDQVLKEVLRKKHDAKKCIVKLDALIKLRRAKQNTDTGRGKPINERDALDFENNIDKLKNLWMLKLSQYDMEEVKLRETLKDQCIVSNTTGSQSAVTVDKWMHFLFGDNKPPQVDFDGDLQKFISTRSRWDQYVDSSGTPLPVGWVLPK